VVDPRPVLVEIARTLAPAGVCILDTVCWTLRSVFPGILELHGGRIHAHSPGFLIGLGLVALSQVLLLAMLLSRLN